MMCNLGGLDKPESTLNESLNDEINFDESKLVYYVHVSQSSFFVCFFLFPLSISLYRSLNYTTWFY